MSVTECAWRLSDAHWPSLFPALFPGALVDGVFVPVTLVSFVLGVSRRPPEGAAAGRIFFVSGV